MIVATDSAPYHRVLWGLASIACVALVVAMLPPRPSLATALSVPTVERTTPDWVWVGPSRDDQCVYLRRQFALDEAIDRARLTASGDNSIVVFLNGKRLLSHAEWEVPICHEFPIPAGQHVLAIEARNDSGPAAVALELSVDGTTIVATDASWRGTTEVAAAPKDWKTATGSTWRAVDVLGRVGDPRLPWTRNIEAADFRDAVPTPGEVERPQHAVTVTDVRVPAGFRVERIYTVSKATQGSWVSLTVDDRGRLYASDQGSKGLFRITPPSIGDREATTAVERLTVDVSGAQGLCWLAGQLYANVQGSRSGLWRIRDGDGDGQLDSAEQLIAYRGAGEHGPHAVIPAPDGKGVYFVGGNHTPMPKFDRSRAPAVWQEDLLLPRHWDARGHARGILAPGGWIAHCDLDGHDVEIVSQGYRNPYDIAFDRNGELFTYDADMEWDMGTSWYRPTRICHATSGSEFGWRSGTGKWPADYEDSCPAVLDIGPGSPTGVLFGYGARFPQRYRDAMYALDWTFGTIYAIHLEAAGASYRATREEFVVGVPLAVTDADIGVDGAFYFAVGGRGSQSALYRVIYEGSDTGAQQGPPPALNAAARLRRQLEGFHGHVDARAIDIAWPQLASSDRAIRFAARIAIENQPLTTWRSRALTEKRPWPLIEAMLMLARHGGAGDRRVVFSRLYELDGEQLTRVQRLAVLRVFAVACCRLDRPDADQRQGWVTRLAAGYPTGDDGIDIERARLQVYLDSPLCTRPTLDAMLRPRTDELPGWAKLIARNGSYGGPIAKMLESPPPSTGIAFARILCHAKGGWTMPLRKRYFQFFNDAAKCSGGASYAGFLEMIRDAALAKLTPDERATLADITGESLIAGPPPDITPPAGPGRTWTVAEASEAIGTTLRGRSFERGRNLYYATLCGACHSMGGEGGAIGPDLTTVGRKFAIRDLLEAIIEPSKVISDQYGSEVVTKTNGESVAGRVVHDEHGVRVFEQDPRTPPVVIAVADIRSIDPSPESQMPRELVNVLNEEELRDLIAFLLSGGDAKAPVFQPAK